MSHLYGILSHSTLSKELRILKKKSFCNCCKTIDNDDDDNNNIVYNSANFLSNNYMLLNFLSEHHLSVYEIEKKISTFDVDNVLIINGRVDCIFKKNLYKNTLYICDWKFSKYIPEDLPIDYAIQLNLYKYIMKQMHQYKNYEIEMYCIIFSSITKNKLKIYKSIILTENFLKNLISRIKFSIN